MCGIARWALSRAILPRRVEIGTATAEALAKLIASSNSADRQELSHR